MNTELTKPNGLEEYCKLGVVARDNILVFYFMHLDVIYRQITPIAYIEYSLLLTVLNFPESYIKLPH